MLKLLVAAAGAVALALAANFAAAGEYAKQKVVYHINYNDEAALKGALRNVQSHINAVGKDRLDLKIVMHGAGVDLLKIANTDMDVQRTIINLKRQHVAFQVCGDTLKGRKIDYRKDLYDVNDADIVPSGVAEIVKLQAEGYVYIKP